MIDNVRIRGGNPVTAAAVKGTTAGAGGFGVALKEAIASVNDMQVQADKEITKVQTQDSASLHEAIIALEKADISFRTMLQVRNKVVEAYQEIMRLQI